MATGEIQDKTDDGKNPAAVALGRMGGLKGKARVESLTKKRRATTYTLASSGDPTTPQSQEEIQFSPL